MGKASRVLDYDPDRKPHQYGMLITAMTTIPCLLSVPFFLLSGFKMREIKRQKKIRGEHNEED